MGPGALIFPSAWPVHNNKYFKIHNGVTNKCTIDDLKCGVYRGVSSSSIIFVAPENTPQWSGT
jgi:hypothetical protein